MAIQQDVKLFNRWSFDDVEVRSLYSGEPIVEAGDLSSHVVFRPFACVVDIFYAKSNAIVTPWRL